MAFSYNKGRGDGVSGTNGNDYYMATQMTIWQFVTGHKSNSLTTGPPRPPTPPAGDPAAVVVEDLEAGGVQVPRQGGGGGEHGVVLAGGQDMHVVGGDLDGPDQAVLVVVGLGQRRHDARDADAVGAHGHHAGPAVLIQDRQPQGPGVLAPQGEKIGRAHV